MNALHTMAKADRAIPPEAGRKTTRKETSLGLGWVEVVLK